MPSSSKVSFSHSRISLLLCALSDFNCLLSGLSFNRRQSLGQYFYLPSEFNKSLQAREADILTF